MKNRYQADHTRQRTGGWGWTLLALAAIIAATLSPAPQWSGSGSSILSSLVPATPSDWGDVLQNALLFIPLGIARAAQGTRFLSVCFSGALLSTAIELMQAWVPGRDPSARDILANTLGAAVGWYALVTPVTGKRLSAGLETGSRWARRLASPAGSTLSFAWVLVVCLLLSAPGHLMTLTPPNPPYAVPGPLLDSTAAPLRIGSTGSADGFFAGAIDEVRIYGRARDEGAIRADMMRRISGAGRDDSDPIAAYGFDTGNGQVARDETGHGHDGAIHGAAWTAQGRFGSALWFDGGSSQVIVPPSPALDLREQMTLEAWIFPVDQLTREPAIVVRPHAFFLNASTEERQLQPSGGGRFGERVEDARPVDLIARRTWTHMAVSYDGATIRLYVDGVLRASTQRWSRHHITRLQLNDAELVPRFTGDHDQIRRAVLGGIDLRATIRCGNFDRSALPIFAAVGPGNITTLGLEASGTDILLSVATRAGGFDLPSPRVRVRGGLEPCRTDARLDFALTGPIPNLRATVNGREVRVAAPGPGTAWAFLLHSELMSWRVESIVTFAWIALLVFPFALGARRSPLTIAGAGLLVLTVTNPTLRGDARAPDVWDVAAAMTGCLLAAICRWRQDNKTRRRPRHYSEPAGADAAATAGKESV